MNASIPRHSGSRFFPRTSYDLKEGVEIVADVITAEVGQRVRTGEYFCAQCGEYTQSRYDGEKLSCCPLCKGKIFIKKS